MGFLLGKPLELWVAIEARVREWISVIYRQPLAQRYTHILASLDPEKNDAAAPAAPVAAQPQQPAPTPPPPAPKPAASEEASLTLELVGAAGALRRQ